MPAPHGQQPRNKKFLLRMTAAEDSYVRRRAARDQMSLNDTLARMIRDAEAAEASEQPSQSAGAFGSPGCTCRPWTRHGGRLRHLGPGESTDLISGWERAPDCPHHPAATAGPGPKTPGPKTRRRRGSARLTWSDLEPPPEAIPGQTDPDQ